MASPSSDASGMATSSELQSIDLDEDGSGNAGAAVDQPVTPLSTEMLEGGPPKKPQMAFGQLERVGDDRDTDRSIDKPSRRHNLSGAGSVLGSRGTDGTASGRTLPAVSFDMDSAPKDHSGR